MNIDFSHIGFNVKSKKQSQEDASITQPSEGRKAWHAVNKEESRCNMVEQIQIYRRKELSFIAFYKKTKEGIPLSDIKVEANVELFADRVVDIIYTLLQMRDTEGWAIITTPKRRHKEKNFSEMVTSNVAKEIGMKFYPDAVSAKNRNRIRPQFTIEKDIKEKNIIIFDDILTTGSTLHAMNALFPDKNIVYIIGINNN